MYLSSLEVFSALGQTGHWFLLLLFTSAFSTAAVATGLPAPGSYIVHLKEQIDWLKEYRQQQPLSTFICSFLTTRAVQTFHAMGFMVNDAKV